MLLVAAALIVWLGHDTAAQIAARAPLAAAGWLHGSGAAFLYLWVPLVTLAASVLLLAPGILAARALWPHHRPEIEWLLIGFTASLVGVPAAAALVQAASGVTMTGGAFVLLALILALPGLALAARRPAGPPVTAELWRWTGAAALLCWLVLVALSPKFYWESLNGDGAHALINTALFIQRGLPFWPDGAGDIGAYPAVTTMTEVFPHTAFVRLMGFGPAAIRLSYLPGLAMLYILLMHMTRTGTAPAWPRLAGIGLALGLLSFVLAYNPSYNPYFADIALPMSREPLIVIGFLGFVHFVRDARYVAAAGVSTLALFTAPNGLLLIGFWLFAHFILARPLPWRRTIAGGLAALSVLVVAVLITTLLRRLELTAPAGEFGADSILQRLRYVTLADFGRLNFWILPCGILPAAALLWWRGQDRLAREMTIVTVIYVLFFQFQAYRVLPHHFVPAMILPLIVFWRLGPVLARPALGLGAAAIGLAVATALSWPANLAPHLFSRDFAARIEVRHATDRFPDVEETRIAQLLLQQAFPMQWTDAGTAQFYVGEPIAWYVQSLMADHSATSAAYVIDPPGGDGPPAGWEIIGDEVEGWTIHVVDSATYQADLSRAGLPSSIAPRYWVARDVVFGRGENEGERRVYDLARIAGLK